LDNLIIAIFSFATSFPPKRFINNPKRTLKTTVFRRFKHVIHKQKPFLLFFVFFFMFFSYKHSWVMEFHCFTPPDTSIIGKHKNKKEKQK